MLDPFPVGSIREQYPGLLRTVGGRPAVYFDGPGGSQVPQRVIHAMSGYLANRNAQHGGLFASSYESDALLAKGHQMAATFLGGEDPDEVAFGQNMTSLTFSFSRAVAKTLSSGDEILLTEQDHDANHTPWILAAQDCGAIIKKVKLLGESCALDLGDLEAKLTSKTRWLALPAASNAAGNVNPLEQIISMAHQRGAKVFVDAVHYAPHRSIDIKTWDCDALVCSAYKFFGPHLGILWGKRALMESLPAYKLEPVPNVIPDRWMTGTQNHEGIAGLIAAIEYLQEMGRAGSQTTLSPRQAIMIAFEQIQQYEAKLCVDLLEGLLPNQEIKVYGLTRPEDLPNRVPTVAFTHKRFSSEQLARRLGEDGIFTWHGNYYALPLTRSLGLEPDGILRVGLLHYNTSEEIRRFLTLLNSY